MTGSVTVDVSRFNVACTVYANELRKAPRDVVAEQAGLLMVDCGRNLPPREPEKTKATIEKTVQGRFGLLNTSTINNTFTVGSGGKEGHGDVHWVGSTSSLLFGIAKEVDKSDATPEDLRKLYYTITKSGKQRTGTRGKQQVFISQKVTTLESTRQKLIKIIQDRVGLLRASFCIGLNAVKTRQKPPAFVMKHVTSGKAKGSFVDGLGIPGAATFTIISNAAGVTSDKAAYFLQGALTRRSNAMMSRIKYLQKEAKEKAGFQ